MMDEFKKEVRLENEKKKSEAIAESNKARKSNGIQLDANEPKNRNYSTNTLHQVSKKVGVGTVARYNKVMNSNADDLKEKVKTGKVTVNKAYEEVHKRETRVCKICNKEKKVIDFFGNDTICKECSRKEFTKSERIDYARQLEHIESAKARERMSLGGQGKENFPTLQTRDSVASQMGIGSGKQYEKEKYIVDNRTTLTPEDFADWDEGKLSENEILNEFLPIYNEKILKANICS